MKAYFKWTIFVSAVCGMKAEAANATPSSAPSIYIKEGEQYREVDDKYLEAHRGKGVDLYQQLDGKQVKIPRAIAVEDPATTAPATPEQLAASSGLDQLLAKRMAKLIACPVGNPQSSITDQHWENVLYMKAAIDDWRQELIKANVNFSRPDAKPPQITESVLKELQESYGFAPNDAHLKSWLLGFDGAGPGDFSLLDISMSMTHAAIESHAPTDKTGDVLKNSPRYSQLWKNQWTTYVKKADAFPKNPGKCKFTSYAQRRGDTQSGIAIGNLRDLSSKIPQIAATSGGDTRKVPTASTLPPAPHLTSGSAPKTQTIVSPPPPVRLQSAGGSSSSSSSSSATPPAPKPVEPVVKPRPAPTALAPLPAGSTISRFGTSAEAIESMKTVSAPMGTKRSFNTSVINGLNEVKKLHQGNKAAEAKQLFESLSKDFALNEESVRGKLNTEAKTLYTELLGLVK